MGVIHRIMQIKPYIIMEGAVLKCKKEYTDKIDVINSKIGEAKNYIKVHEERISFHVHTQNFLADSQFIDPDKKLFITISSGSKRAFNIIQVVEDLSPFVEDATFYLHNDWTFLIEEFKIKNGKLYYKCISDKKNNPIEFKESINDEIFEYVEQLYIKDKKFLQELYYSSLFHTRYNGSSNFRDEGLKIIEKAIKLNNKDWRLYHFKGITYNNLKKYKEAITCLHKALKLIPDSQKVNVEIEETTGKFTTTKTIKTTTAKKALQYDPVEFRYWFEDATEALTLAYKEIYLNLGEAYKEIKENEKALIHYLKAENILPTYHDHRILSWLTCFYLDTGEYGKAIVYSDKLLKFAQTKKEIAIAYYNKACAYAMQNNPKKALAFLALSIELNREYKINAQKDEGFINLYNLKAFKKLME